MGVEKLAVVHVHEISTEPTFMHQPLQPDVERKEGASGDPMVKSTGTFSIACADEVVPAGPAECSADGKEAAWWRCQRFRFGGAVGIEMPSVELQNHLIDTH
jgi:hypothetical protein